MKGFAVELPGTLYRPFNGEAFQRSAPHFYQRNAVGEAAAAFNAFPDSVGKAFNQKNLSFAQKISVTISAIAAMDKNRVIGKDNDIPWYLPDDFKYFKKTTLNHHIIMGRKCFESIGRPLPKRTNIILTRNPFYLVSNCLVMSSLDEALAIAKENGDEEPFICGGGQIYEMAMPLCDRLYITEIDTEIAGNKEELIYFPEIDKDIWEMVWEEQHPKDERHEHAFTFKKYERRSA